LYIFFMETLNLASLDDLSLLIHEDLVASAKSHSGLLRLGLPGGRSVTPLIKGILSCPPQILARLRLYLVDERLSGETNRNTLLDAGLEAAFARGLLQPEQLVVPELGKHFLEGDLSLLYLGVGEDGHIASLFPGSYPEPKGQGNSGLVFVGNSPKPPADRVTVTYQGFLMWASKANIRLLFLGEGKRSALSRLLSGKEGATSLPCSFFNRTEFKVTVVTDIKGIPI
jgi:6-phosphogluconolactonase/glucosamine-6-phosphate isomerase/deaminase